jgi:CubicO group peptidase (beta-lactamase class C family)
MSSAKLAQAPSKTKIKMGDVIVIRNGYDVWHHGDAYGRQGNTSSVVRSYLTTLYGSAIRQGIIPGGRNAVERRVNSLDSATAKTFDASIKIKHLVSYTSCGNPPGSKWNYNCNFNKMCEILMELYHGHWSENGMVDLCDAKLKSVLGGSWYPKYWTKKQHKSTSYFRIYGNPSGMAYWGYLWLHRGKWKGKQLVDPWFVDRSIQPMPKPNASGYANENEGWQIHLNKTGVWKGLPKDCYAAMGACDRSSILVCPSLNLVIARKGPTSSPYSDRCVDSPQRWAKPIFDAINDDAGLPAPTVWPGSVWATQAPTEVGMDSEKLAALADYVGGRGCVVRHGCMIYSWGSQSKRDYVYSAEKPWYAHFLWKALEDGKIPNLDQKVNLWEPRLNSINANLGHKDRNITWRHLANQTSCYGVRENPGDAFNYNDYQMALFWDTLFLKVYGATYDTVDSAVLHPMLTDVLQCQDNPTFVASGHGAKGSLGVSVRDFARFGLLYLRKGNWKGKQLISTEHARTAVTSPLPTTLPNSTEELAEVIARQRTIGRVARVQKQGPHRGSYSWLWWTNGVDRTGQRFYPDAPVDLYGAFGKNGNVMAIIPSLDLIVSWSSRNTATVTTRNEAFKRLVQAVTDTRVSIVNGKWHINGAVTYPGAKAEGLLMNVRMVNCTFEDLKRPDFDAEANTNEFIAKIPDYVAHGVRAFTLNLQGGMPGYEGAVNSAFNTDGTLRKSYLKRVRRVIEACNRHGVVVILGCYYQRQDQILKDEDALRTGVVNAVKWIKACRFTNVVLEINNEYAHKGFGHRLLRTPEGVAELIRLAKRTAPELLVSASGYGDGRLAEPVARASDFLLIHFNGTPLDAIPGRIAALKRFGKPIVCNEDNKLGTQAAKATELSVANGASWGLMLQELNQHLPFTFKGAADAPIIYAKLKELTLP